MTDKVKVIPKKANGQPVMGPTTGKKFTATYRPDPAKVQAGREKRKLLKDILNSPLLKTKTHSKGIELCAKYMQIDESEITLADLLHFKQAQKAYRKSDTFAYQALMDRTYGKPESKTTLANDADHPITPLNIEQVNVLIEAIKKTT